VEGMPARNWIGWFAYKYDLFGEKPEQSKVQLKKTNGDDATV